MVLVGVATLCAASKQAKNSAPQLTYSLPKTALAIDVEMERVAVTAGPYYRYAERYLNVKNAATEDGVTWRVKGIRLRTVGVADENLTFTANSARSIAKTKEGVIAGWNVVAEPKEEAQEKNEFIPISGEPADPRAYSEDQLSANSVSQMAQTAAKEIYRIRDSRVSLATGDILHVPADGESVRQMFAQMDSAEARLMSLFVGNETKTKVTKTYLYVPGKKDVKNDLMFRLSPESGMVSKEDLSGVPVYITMRMEKSKVPPAKTESGELFYILPGSAHVKIDVNDQTVIDETVQLAQMGSVQALPASYKNAKVTYDTATGEVVVISY